MTASARRGDGMDLRALLAPIVGSERVSLAGEAARVDGVRAQVVVRPGSVDEVRAITRICAQRGLALVATGRGRHLDVGAPPERCEILLRLERLDAVLDHQPGDMTVTVAAGCTLAALDQTLARHGQWLPLDPPLPEATTVGGLVSANLSGPLRASQGTVRDLVLGVDVVDAEGALVRGGGRVVKNVAGYDLPKLYVGALGSLGVVVAATFKVRPRPAVEKAVVVACASAEEAARAALSIREATEPFWLELATAGGGVAVLGARDDRVSAGRASDDDASAQLAVAAGMAGFPAEVEDGVERIRRVAGVRGLSSEVVDDGASLRARLAPSTLDERAAVLRASVLPTDVEALLTAIDTAAQDEGVRVSVGAHFANGIVRASVVERRVVPELVRRLRREVAALGGHLVVERASADTKADLGDASAVWGDPGSGLSLMRGVKATLDPDRTLSPGRLPGGI